jgi:choline-sulfatase
MREHAHDEQPWVLFVSFVCPHPPYIAPQRLFDLYPPDQVPMPPQWRPEERPDHPALRRMREKFGLEPLDEPRIRKAIAAYFGACTYLDERVGEVLKALEATGLQQRTRVIYSSDHGEDLGARGLFGKFTMYEESAGVPLIVAGPDVPAGAVVDAPVSLVDLYPTIAAAVGIREGAPSTSPGGASLWDVLEAPGQFQNRPVLSQYHAVNSRRGISMLRQGRFKLVYYVEEPAQLFDLQDDPQELHNLAEDPQYQPTRERLITALRKQLDPETVDIRARADQAALIERLGGEEAVRRRGTFDNSPVPGEHARFRDHA